MIKIVYMRDIRPGVPNEGPQFLSRLYRVEHPASRFDCSCSVCLGVKIYGGHEIIIPRRLLISWMVNSERNDLMTPLLEQPTDFQHILLGPSVKEEKLIDVENAHKTVFLRERLLRNWQILLSVLFMLERTRSINILFH